MIRAALAAVSLAFVAVSSATAVAQAPGTRHVRGEVQAVEADMIRVKDRDGAALSLRLKNDVRFSGIKAAKLDDIKAGAYVGTAAIPQRDGTLMAQEVLIFPEAMRGTGEGHRPWDLTPDSTMTNATVDGVVAAAAGPVLTLKYKDGEKRVTVSPATPIVTIVPADRAMLRPGVHVFAVAETAPDGGLLALRVAIGIDGLVPPM
ncbi:MAG: hypothetical protein FJX67_11515 [Alphaproteobacteria bacterium]|nr:hypothetical protein [Alphaproteobacteria bacterium]